MEILPKGSEWRKWDLHFHSSHTYLNRYQATENDIINELVEKDISAIGLTNYFKFDEKDYELKKQIEEKKICVFLNLELRLTYQNKENDCCDLHIIFDNKLDPNSIKDFLSNLTLHVDGSQIKAKDINDTNDFKKAVVELSDVVRLLKDESLGLKDKYLIGFLSRGKGNARSSSAYEIIAKSSDLLIHSSENETNIDIDRKYWYDKYRKPLLQCSDAHNIEQLGSKFSWIKADPTFEGLKQIIHEPKERISIQDLMPEQKAGYQVIESVEITHSDFLSQTLYFNQNLNSIIGGRSTGKSILLGAIAKKLNCDKEVKSENEEYINFVNEIVNNIVVTWKDNTVNDNRDIEYFPQSYMYTLARNKNKELDKLIENIIKQDSSKNQLISNYETFSNENNSDITNKVNKIFQIQEDLVKKKTLLKEKGDRKGIESEIEKLTKELADLKSKSKISENDLKKYTELKAKKDSILKENEILVNEVTRIENLKEKFFVTKEIGFELISISETNRKLIKDKFESLKSKFQNDWNNEIDKIQVTNQKKKTKNQGDIDSINVNPTYDKGLKAFQNNTQYREVEEKLKKQKDKLADIIVIKKEVDRLKSQIDSYKSSIKESQREFLNKIESIKKDLEVSREKLKINAVPKFNKDRYRELLNYSINQQGGQGQEIVNITLDTIENFFTSAHNLFDKLLEQKVTIKRQNTYISLCQKLMATNFFEISYEIVYDDTFSKMSEGKKAFVVLLLLLDFSNKDCPILIDQPEDDLDNRAIYRDLVQYLIKKKKERQIILVTHNPNIVVGSDSELIIVANQNGIDSPNKNSSKFQYVSGSIENSRKYDKDATDILGSQGIREHICEILEGGNEAFKKRERKYSIIS